MPWLHCLVWGLAWWLPDSSCGWPFSMWNLSSPIRDGQSQQGDTSRERKHMGLSFPRMAYNLDFTLKQKEFGGRGHWRTTQALSPTQEQPWEWVGRPQSGAGACQGPGPDLLQTGSCLAQRRHTRGSGPSGGAPSSSGLPNGRPSTRFQEGKALQAPRPPDAASQHRFCRHAESRSLPLGVPSKVKSIFSVLGRLGLG